MVAAKRRGCLQHRTTMIWNIVVGSQRAVSPDRPKDLPWVGRLRLPISLWIGVRPPNSSQQRPRRRAFPLPACFLYSDHLKPETMVPAIL